MTKEQRFDKLVMRKMGSKAALLRALQRNNTPVKERTLYNWMRNVSVLQIDDVFNLSRAMDIPPCELLNTIKGEGDE